MPSPLSDRLDRLYGDRPRVEQLRARGMALLYGACCVALVLMFVGDVFGAPTSLWLLALIYTLVGALLGGGLYAVFTGRDELATRVVPVIFVCFCLGTVGVALDGNPHRFVTNWSKWFPLFILINALLLSEVQALALTIGSVAWTWIYYLLFAGIVADTPVAILPTDMVDATVVPLMVGALTLALLRFIRTALAKEQEVNAALEATVAERTQALRDAFQEREAVIEHMADGVLSVAPDGAVRVSNSRLEELCPGTEESPAPRVRELIDRVRETGEPEMVQLDLEDHRVVKVVASPVPTEEGTGVVAIVHDITLEAEVDRLKTDFISTVSHELRTPLTSILGFSKMIRSRLDRRVSGAVDPENARATKAMGEVLSNLGIVVSEGERLTALINDVLDIAKMEAGRVDWREDPVDVDALVRTASAAVAGLFPEDRPVSLRVESEGELGVVLGDEPRLVQVLVNLLSNASKFTEEGSVILRAERQGAAVELSVRDTGAGIPANALETIFDRFRQAESALTDKPQGTGLGLPICRQIARAHHSEITVESTVGGGSRFAMRLPLYEPSEDGAGVPLG